MPIAQPWENSNNQELFGDKETVGPKRDEGIRNRRPQWSCHKSFRENPTPARLGHPTQATNSGGAYWGKKAEKGDLINVVTLGNTYWRVQETLSLSSVGPQVYSNQSGVEVCMIKQSCTRYGMVGLYLGSDTARWFEEILIVWGIKGE